MTEKRLHGKATLDPQEYRYVRSIDNDAAVALAATIPIGTFGDALARWAEECRRLREDEAAVRRLVAPHSLYQCTHCGARIRYAVVWLHVPTGEHIVTGEQCAEERMALESRAALELSLAKKAAAAQAAAAKLRAEAHRWIAAHEALWDAMLAARGDSFVAAMVAAVAKYGSLTERQEAALPKALDRVAEWTTEGATCELHEVVEAPEGKAVVVEGEVLRAEYREGGFGGGRFVMTVRTDAGWAAWGTVPTTLVEAVGSIDDLRGQRVRFVADLTRSPGKAGMAFTKRPRQAVVLAA